MPRIEEVIKDTARQADINDGWTMALSIYTNGVRAGILAVDNETAQKLAALAREITLEISVDRGTHIRTSTKDTLIN